MQLFNTAAGFTQPLAMRQLLPAFAVRRPPSQLW